MSYQSPYAASARRAEAATTSMAAPFLDWMLTMQRQMLSMQQQAMSLYGLPAWFARTNGAAHASTRNEEVVALGRETLNVDTRVVNQGTTRVRRFVVETPVEEKVPLRQERVIVERRRPIAISDTGDTLVEKIVEMSDTNEIPVVWTKLELAEEVVLRREVNERMETVRSVVRHDEVEIDQVGHDHSRAIAPRPQALSRQASNQPAVQLEPHPDRAAAAKTQEVLAEAKATFGAHDQKTPEQKAQDQRSQDQKASGEHKPAAETKANPGSKN
jgi:stress response protein YsnF